MKKFSDITVVIDPGHGGHDPGGTGNGLKEKDLVLEIGLEVGRLLKALGINVLFTRTTDIFVTLVGRADIANKANADMFVSIHINAGGGVMANGVEVFSFPGSVDGMDLSKALLQSILADNIFKVNRGNKTANFAVLRRTNMPAALTETGFIDHKGDVEIIKAKNKEIANSIYKGILNYLKIPVNSKPDNKELYRVRKSWEDVNSQAGAYSELSNAILLAKEIGLNVYDSKGKEVYKHEVKDHWGEKLFKELNDGGIKIHEKRFDDPITRAEAFALAAQLLKKKMI